MSCGKMTVTLFLFAVFLAAGSLTAEAGVITIFSEKLRVAASNEASNANPIWATSMDGGSATYWALVKLPLGARVRKLELISWGTGAPSTRLSLLRTKVGEALNFYGSSRLMFIWDTTVNPPHLPPTVTSTRVKANADSDLVVRRGYRYFIQLTTDNSGSFAKGVKVYYR